MIALVRGDLRSRRLDMPLHDWRRIEAAIFHSFHLGWIVALHHALNEGLLPEGHYSLIEQHAGYQITDILTLPIGRPPPAPQVQRRQTVEPAALARRRSLAIRHVSGHRLVALLEIVSPANKDRVESVTDFTAKVVKALDAGVHVLLIDLLPPSPHDPQGMHGAVVQRLAQGEEAYDLPSEGSLTLASYVAGPRVDIYLNHPVVGDPLPAMPLFLRPDRYVNVPLEATYQAAYRGMPAFWRDVLEGRTPEGL
jgi:hypothetical protein